MIKIFDNKVLKNFLLLFINIFVLEIIFKLVMGINVLEWSTFRIALGAVIFSVLVSILLSYAKRIVQNIFILIISFLWTLIAIVQAGFYNYLGTYMSVGTASQAGAVGDFIGDFIDSFKWTYWLCLIPFILIIIYCIFIDARLKLRSDNLSINFFAEIRGKRKRAKAVLEDKLLKKKNLNINRLIGLGCLVVSIGLYVATLYIPFMQSTLQMVSNNMLFKSPSMPNIAVSQFGITGFEFIDVKALVFGADEDDLSFDKAVQEVTDYSRIIDDTLWNKAIEEETDKTYKTLNSYFMSKTITDKNQYTGLFEDKNVIMVMMESAGYVFLDYPDYFPNITKLYNEGWSWTNSFSPRNACSTGNNEMSGLTSLYTINRSCTANVYKDNTYFEALFNLYNYKGYNTSSYHDYTDHFYYRHTIHPNMGSNSFYGVSDLGIKLGSGYQPWPSDVEFMEKALPNFINEDKFMAFLTTVSSHMSYKNSSVTGDMYLDLYKDESWGTNTKRYMSKLKILDNSLGKMIEMLSSAGKLDDTVIVLFADHYPYGLSSDAYDQIAKYDISSNGDIDRTPFIIYNPELSPTKYDEYTSYMNILPTLANLFNLDYDPRLYGGSDLLSEDYDNRVVFPDGSWRSDIAYYDATSSKITYLGEETYSDSEIVAINNKIKNEIKMNNLAIENNYFEYLGNILNKKLIVNTDTIKEDDLSGGEGMEDAAE